MRTTRYILFVLMLAATSAAAGGLDFMPPVSLDPAVPGTVRVKVSRQLIASGVSAGMLGETGRRFGVFRISPWLEPGLLTFRQTTFKQSAGGAWESPERSLSRIMVVEYSATTAPEEVARVLQRIPGVEYAEPIHRAKLLRSQSFMPNDPDIGDLWHLTKIRAPQAWDIKRGDSTMIVATIDAGIDRNHVDLRSSMWRNWGESGTDGTGDRGTNNIDDDGNGLIDDMWGWDFSGSTGYTPDNDPMSENDYHGTHVAGIVGATGNNGIGIAGVAFGVKVMAVKIGDNGSVATLFREYDGVVYAVQMGAKIVNCSWGNRSISRAEREVINWARGRGVLVVAAAGNDGNETEFFPASYPGVLSVTAVDQGDQRSSFSNINGKVGMSAPGARIISTKLNDTYGEDSGTSMATPMVSAAAALVSLKYPSLDGEAIAEILRASSDDISGSLGGAAEYMGSGRLNVERALSNGTAIRSARVVSHMVIDPNGDGALMPGETVRIALDVKNILAASSGVRVEMTARDPASTQISNGEANLGAMSAGQTIATGNGTMLVKIDESTPLDGIIVLRVAVLSDDRTNLAFIRLHVNPTWMTTDLNRIQTTFNSVGNIGYNGTNTRQGLGFKYDTLHSMLYQSGLMIGTSDARVSDVVRISDQQSDGTANGFRMVRPYRITTASDSSVQIGTARFDDSHRSELVRVGVDVEMTTYEYRRSSLDNCVIVVYNVTNTSGATLSNLHCGLYFDWDIDIIETDNRAIYDATGRLGYARNMFNENSMLAAAGLISNQTVDFYAIDNESPSDGIISYTADRKWRHLSSGIGRAASNTGDISMVIGGGPVTIEPGASETFAFVLMGGRTLAQLRTTATNAHDEFVRLSGVRTSEEVAAGVSVAPMPFSDGTTIELTLDRPGTVSLKIFELGGREVARPFEGRLDAGRQMLPIDGSLLADGVYLYELRTPDGLVHGRLVKIAR